MWPSLAQLRSCSVNPVSSGLIWIEINFDLYRIYFSLITQIQKGFDVTEHALNLSERSCSCVTHFLRSLKMPSICLDPTTVLAMLFTRLFEV
jgi:hypothetical protein